MVDERIEKYSEYGIIALVNHIKDNEHSDSLTMTYGEFANKINNLDKGNNAHHFLDIGKVLDHIWNLWSDFHKNNRYASKPYITIFFVGDNSEFPSEGYGKLDTKFNALTDDEKREKMKEQTKLIKEYLRSGKLDKFLLKMVRADCRDALPIQEDDNSKIGEAEGETIRAHRKFEYRSRDYHIVKKKKKKSEYICECCRFDFPKTYGEEYIECHHIKPLADYSKMGEKARWDNLAALCSNCHRMIHRLLVRNKEKYKDKYSLSMDDLRDMVKKC